MAVILVPCPNCKKDVLPVIKMFDTKVCPHCNIILDSKYSISKGN